MSLLGFLRRSARDNPSVWAQGTLLDENTGLPIALASVHREMQVEWNHPRSVVWAFPGAGKSQQLKARVAWELWRDPNLRVAWLAGSLAQSERMVGAVGDYISSPLVQQVTGGQLTLTQRSVGALSVAGQTRGQKDASVTASAVGLGSTLGQRFDLIVCDDLLNWDNTRTPVARDTAWREFVTGTLSRGVPGFRVWMVGTAWHTDDVMHRAARLDGWRSKRFPVLDEQGCSTWPLYFPSSRIEQKRLELSSPVTFAREMLCHPLDEASIVFEQEHIDLAMRQGCDPRFTARGSRRVVIGVDPAWTTAQTSDESAIVLVAIDDFANRHLTHAEAGRWHHEQLANRVVELARANRATVYCESNGAGGVIADMIGRRAPCKPLATTRTSKQARVEGLSAELASGRWCFSQPLGYPGADLKRLADELATFSFDSHCGDRLAALLVAVEGCRALESRPKARWHHLDLMTR